MWLGRGRRNWAEDNGDHHPYQHVLGWCFSQDVSAKADGKEQRVKNIDKEETLEKAGLSPEVERILGSRQEDGLH